VACGKPPTMQKYLGHESWVPLSVTTPNARQIRHQGLKSNLSWKVLIWFVLLCAGLLPATVANAGGLTILTHGYQKGDEIENLTWLDAMTNYVQDKNGGNGAVYELIVDKPGGVLRTRLFSVAGFRLDGAANTSGEVVIKLIWANAAGLIGSDEASTVRIAQQAFNMLINWDQGPSPLVGPIHLIGHSRGGSVVCQLAKVLGERGIWTDHLTTLDPRPVPIFGDASATVWETVNFADNYYQKGTIPSGIHVPLAFSLDVSARIPGRGYVNVLFGPHSNIHLWYHGTLNTDIGASNGDVDGNGNQIIFSTPMRQVWYPGESLGTSSLSDFGFRPSVDFSGFSGFVWLARLVCLLKRSLFER